MSLPRSLKAFFTADDGAITVDWVVITAAVMGIALAVMIVLGGSTHDYSETIASEMSTRGVTSY